MKNMTTPGVIDQYSLDNRWIERDFFVLNYLQLDKYIFNFTVKIYEISLNSFQVERVAGNERAGFPHGVYSECSITNKETV